MAPMNEWLADEANRARLKTKALYRGSFDGDDPDTVHYDFNRTREDAELRSFLEGFGAADFDAHSVTLDNATTATFGTLDDYLRTRLVGKFGIMGSFNKAGNGVAYLVREDGTIRRGAKTSETVAWLETQSLTRGDQSRRSVERTGKVLEANEERMRRAEVRALRAAPEAGSELRQVGSGYREAVQRQLQSRLHFEPEPDGA